MGAVCVLCGLVPLGYHSVEQAFLPRLLHSALHNRHTTTGHGKQALTVCFICVSTDSSHSLYQMVAVSFWTVYAIDRELIYPAANDEFIPFILNHFWHTTVIICVLVELAIVFHRYPTTKTALLVIYLSGGSYLAWITWVFFASGRWPYPFLHALPSLPLFLLATLLLSPGLFFCGKALCYLRWQNRW